MDLNSYLKEIKKIPAVIYLMMGEEVVLQNDLRQQTERIANAQQAQFSTFDLAEDSIDEFLVELDNTSLFANKRYLYVTHFFSSFKKRFTKKQANFLENKLSGAIPEVTLIFNGCDETIDKRISINKKIAQQAKVVNLSKLKPNEIQAKMVHYFQKKPDITVERGAIEEILKRTNYDYTALRGELPKLELFLVDQTELTIQNVKDLITINPNDNIFGLIDAVSRKSFKDVMGIYRELLDYYEQPYLLNGALISNFQLLLQVKILSDGSYDQIQIQRELAGIHPYRIKIALKNSQRFSTRQLIDLNHLLLVMDQKIKTESVNYDELFMDLLLELKVER